MDLPIEQLADYLLRKSIGGSSRKLDTREQTLLDTLKKLGVTKLSADVLAYIEKGDYNAAIYAARATILDTTKNFVVASMGVSDGPLSELLGIAIEAATSNNTDKLRAIVDTAKKSDPELGDAIERFLKGNPAAIATLAARRAGADPKLVKIADGVASGSVENTLQATSEYAGLSANQTALVTAAWRTINSKTIDKKSVEAVAQFVAEADPDWKTAKEDIRNGYTLATASADLISSITTFHPSYPLPKTIDQFGQIAEIKAKDAKAFAVGAIAAMGSIITSAIALGASIAGASSAAGPIGVVVGIVVLIVTIAAAFALDKYFKHGNEDVDVQFAKDRLQELTDEGLIPPSVETITSGVGSMYTAARIGRFYEGMRLYSRRYPIFPSTSDRGNSLYGSGGLPTCLRPYGVKLEEAFNASVEIFPLMKNYSATSDLNNLAIACSADGQGGPFASEKLTDHNLGLLAALVATRYSVPIKVVCLALSDLFTRPVVSGEKEGENLLHSPSPNPVKELRGYQYNTTKVVPLVSGKTMDIPTTFYCPARPPTSPGIPDWYNSLRTCAGINVEGGRQKTASGREFDVSKVEYRPDGIYVDGKSNEMGKYGASLTDLVPLLERLRPNPDVASKDENIQFRAIGGMVASPILWMELTWLCTVMVQTYIKVVGPSIGPYGTRQQIGIQVALYMDQHPTATFETAVAASLKAPDSEKTGLIVQLREAGLDATNPLIYARQVDALLASKKCKTKTEAMKLIDTMAGNAVPTDPVGYGKWFASKSYLYQQSGGERRRSASAPTKAPARAKLSK